MISKKLLTEARKMEEELIQKRRYLHMHPEVGFELPETLEFVARELKAMGYAPQKCGKAGLTITVGKKNVGKTFLIRGDMDALPIHEESDVEFASTNEFMHACGHDMHTVMLLGAAKLLKQYENEINGTIKFMFQPAEEIFLGAKDMIDAGILKNPQVDAALMIHVMAGIPMPAGTVMVCNGGVSASAADSFDIIVRGKGCHSSIPEAGADPISAAAHIVTAFHEIHARELNISTESVLTIGTFHAGNAANAIPEIAEMSGTLRTYDEKIRSFIKSRMEEIVKSVGMAFRCEVEIRYREKGCPTLLNDGNLSTSVTGYLRELFEPNSVFTLEQIAAFMGKKSLKAPGSEDFAFVSQEVPSVMVAIAAGQPELGYKYTQHHPQVKFDEKVLAPGSAIYAYTAMRWLEEH